MLNATIFLVFLFFIASERYIDRSGIGTLWLTVITECGYETATGNSSWSVFALR